MSVLTLEDVLRAHPAFAGFDADARAQLAGCGRNVRFAPGETLYREGDPADRVFLLREGDVAIEVSAPARAPLVIETLHAGDIVGWGWMVPPYRSMSDARAQTTVRAVSLDAACMRRKCDEAPALGYAVFRNWMPHVAQRVRALRLQLVDLYGTPSERGRDG